MKNLVKFATLSLLSAALVTAPLASFGQDVTTNSPAATTPVKPKKNGTVPFHGKVATVDATAGTLTIGDLSLKITSKTKITKDGKPGTLSDATVGENVSGSYKKASDGKLDVTSLHIGVKAKKKKAVVS